MKMKKRGQTFPFVYIKKMKLCIFYIFIKTARQNNIFFNLTRWNQHKSISPKSWNVKNKLPNFYRLLQNAFTGPSEQTCYLTAVSSRQHFDGRQSFIILWCRQAAFLSSRSVCVCFSLFRCLCIFLLTLSGASSYPTSLLPKRLLSRTIPPPPLSVHPPPPSLSHLSAGLWTVLN